MNMVPESPNGLVDVPEESGLVFDCDGTLADTMPLHYVAWRKALDRYGLTWDEDRFYAAAGQPAGFITRKLIAEQAESGNVAAAAVHDTEAFVEQFVEEKEGLFLELLPQVQPIQPIVDIALHYRGTRRMGVGSGSGREIVFQVLEHIGLKDHFDAVVGAEDTALHKPEPDVFLEVARRIDVAPEKCRVYEDADLGIEAARRGGMTWFDIRTVYQPRRID